MTNWLICWKQYDECVRAGRNAGEAVRRAQQLDPDMQREFADTARCLQLIDSVRRTGTPGRDADETGAAEETGAPPPRIGRFEIVRELGSGGHGVVFLAWDTATRRRVALKTPHPNALFTPELRERFVREGIAAARLTHPNLVSVYEVGRPGPLCFIVSAYSDGRSLASLLQDTPGPLRPDLAARWVAELADGVEHAHRHGVLHRDIKPANVVLESCGPRVDTERAPAADAAADRAALNALTPKLTDFGLAKLIDVEDAHTRSGVLLGTPAYMAPEQVDVALGPLGRQADVYGLGTVLYECLTARPPFASENQADLLRQIAAGDVTPPRTVCSDVPRDLEAICLRAMARKPGDRYASPAELAADLRRFLAGDVTRARPLSVVGRALKWSRRRPTAAAVAAVAILAAVALTAGAVWHFAQMEAALTAAARARIRAENGESKLKQLIYLRDMQEAYQALEDQDVLKASAVLARQKVGEVEEAGFLWRHLAARASGMPTCVPAHQGHAHTVDYSPDGTSIVTSGADGLVRIWDAESGSLRTSLRTEAAEINAARFAPDGGSIAVAASDGRLLILDVGRGAFDRELKAGPLANINCLAWTRDGRVVAAGNPGDAALVWDVSADTSRVVSLGHSDEVNALVLSPGDALVATASSDGTVAIHELTDQATRRAQLQPEQSHVACVTFSPDGTLLATAGVHGSVRIWSVADWSPLATYEAHVDRIGAVVFSPRDPVIAIADESGVIREWDWQRDRVERIVDSGHGRVMHAAYSPTAPCFAACFSDGSLALWDQRNQARISLPGMQRLHAGFTRDSRYLVSAHGAELSLFDTRTRTVTRLNIGSELGAIAILPVGRSQIGILQQTDSRAIYHHGPPGNLTSLPLANRSPIGEFAVSADQRILISANRCGPDHVRFWDAATGRPLGATPDRCEVVHCLCASSHSDLLAIGSAERVRLWDLARRTCVQIFAPEIGTIESLAISPGDRWLAAGGRSGGVCLWDMETGERLPWVLEHSAPVSCLTFCPDDPILVTGDEAGIVRAWSLTSGEELVRLASFDSSARSVSFSPDGQWLAASHVDRAKREMRLWHAPRERAADSSTSH